MLGEVKKNVFQRMLMKTAPYPNVDQALATDCKWRRLAAIFYLRNRENVQLARPILIRSNLRVLSFKMCVKKREKAAKQIRHSLCCPTETKQWGKMTMISIQKMQGLWCCKFNLKDLIAPVWIVSCLNTELGCQTRNTPQVLSATNCKANRAPLPPTQLQL